MSNKYGTVTGRYSVTLDTAIMRPIILGTPIAIDRNREAKMEEQKEKVLLNFKNINDAYVIVKRYNGGVYFKRVDYVTDVKGYPKSNCIYYTKIEADAKVVQLNTDRSKCKYSVESAGKYFINMYSVNSYGTPLTIKNEPVSIKDFEANKYNKGNLYKTLNEAIDYAKSRTDESFKRQQHSADRALKELPEAIKRLEQQAKERYEMYSQSANEEKQIIDKLESFKAQDFKEYETQGDKIARVLYAKAEPVTKDNRTITTADMP